MTRHQADQQWTSLVRPRPAAAPPWTSTLRQAQQPAGSARRSPRHGRRLPGHAACPAAFPDLGARYAAAVAIAGSGGALLVAINQYVFPADISFGTAACGFAPYKPLVSSPVASQTTATPAGGSTVTRTHRSRTASRRGQVSHVSAVWGAHDPLRPSWDCRSCAAPWPCLAAQQRLFVAYRTRRCALGFLLAVLRDQAVVDLPDADPRQIGTRFIGWYRRRMRPQVTARSDRRNADLTPDRSRRSAMPRSPYDVITWGLIDHAVALRDNGDVAEAEAVLAKLVGDCDPRRHDDTSTAAVQAWMSVADPADPEFARHLAYLHQHREQQHGSAHPDTIRAAHDLAGILQNRGDHAAAAAWYLVAADGYTAAHEYRQAVLHRLDAALSAHTAGRCTTAHGATTAALHTVVSRLDLHHLGPAAVWAAAAILVGCDRPHAGEAVLVTHEHLLPAPGTPSRYMFASTCYTQLLHMAAARHRRFCTRGTPATSGLYQHGRTGTPDAKEAFFSRWHALLAGTPLPATAHGDGWRTPAIRHEVYRRRQVGRLSVRAIAGQLGCSPATVTRILRDADLPTGRPA